MASNGKNALVTGASSGIGLELSRLLAKDGYNLVLVARSEGKLNELATELKAAHGVESRVVVADLARSQACDELFAAVKDLSIDILVNNAGYTVYGDFTDSEPSAQLDMLQVNITSLTHLCHLFLPGMKARKWGRVLNLASTAAFQPGPLMATYYASKSYVLSFSEAIACELEGTGVTVTTLCPGPTHTGFAARGKAENSALFKGRSSGMGADQVAAIGYAAMLRGKPLVIAGMWNAFMAWSTRFAPRALMPRVVRSMQATRS